MTETTRLPRLSTREIRALEKVFAAEIEGRLPFQSRAKVYQELVEAGYLSRDRRIFGGRFPIEAEGFALTHLGRFSYCERAAGAARGRTRLRRTSASSAVARVGRRASE
jgi:hypothetical protein